MLRKVTQVTPSDSEQNHASKQTINVTFMLFGIMPTSGKEINIIRKPLLGCNRIACLFGVHIRECFSGVYFEQA